MLVFIFLSSETKVSFLLPSHPSAGFHFLLYYSLSPFFPLLSKPRFYPFFLRISSSLPPSPSFTTSSPNFLTTSSPSFLAPYQSSVCLTCWVLRCFYMVEYTCMFALEICIHMYLYDWHGSHVWIWGTLHHIDVTLAKPACSCRLFGSVVNICHVFTKAFFFTLLISSLSLKNNNNNLTIIPYLLPFLTCSHISAFGTTCAMM